MITKMSLLIYDSVIRQRRYGNATTPKTLRLIGEGILVYCAYSFKGDPTEWNPLKSTI